MLRRHAEKVEFWRWVLVEFERSGVSVREFCRQEGILEPSFYSWRKKIAQLDAGSQESFPKLMPVRVVPGSNGNEMMANDTVANGPRGFDSSTSVPASISASFWDKTPVHCDSKSTSDSSKSDSHSALASEPVMSAMGLTGVVPSPQIEVATPSGLLVRIGQACSLTLIERTLLAIENVYQDKPYGQPYDQAYGQPDKATSC
jgi:hypothetical protein